MENFKFKYLPQEAFKRILSKVQQAREDKVDEWRWQMHLAEVNKISNENHQSSTTSSSNDLSSSIEEQHRDVEHFVDSPDLNESIANQQQHIKTCETIRKMQNNIRGILAGISIQFSQLKTEEIEEPTSPRAAKNRQIRINEFNARFKRNHLYLLQVEIERASKHQAKQLSSINCGPRHTARQLALRSLERAHVLVLQALQVFQRQSRALKEILTSHHLMGDLLLQLTHLSEISTALDLSNEDLDNQRHKLDSQFCTNILEEDMAHLGLTAPTRKLTKKKNIISSHSSTVLGRPKRAQKSKTPARLQKSRPTLVKRQTSQQRSEDKEPSRPEDSLQCANPNPNLHSKTSSSLKLQEQQPVNVRLYAMQHEDVVPPTVKLTEVQDAVTQTLSVQSKAVGTDIPYVSQEESNTEDEQVHQGTPQRPINESFTLRLQRAILEELQKDTNTHVDPLIEQLLREEFL